MIGFRAATGQRGEIDKRAWFIRAMLHGALAGQLCVAIAGLVVLLLVFGSSDPNSVWQLFNHCGWYMLLIYLPYALIVLTGFVLRALIPILDVRSALNLILFGPFTILRAPVVGAGLIWGVSVTPGWQVTLLATIVALLMFGLEPVLIQAYSKPLKDPAVTNE
jgi:hypothetical protein